MSKWFGPNNEEFTCKCGCGLNVIDPEIVRIADDVRYQLGVPLIVESGTRCTTHNADPQVGGAPHSAHLPAFDGYSHAIDFRCFNDVLRAKIRDAFARRGIRRFEISNKHIHVDNAGWLPTPLLASVVFRGAAPET
jgi:zinc D-Ala-D-Ala carboxypeptidase